MQWSFVKLPLKELARTIEIQTATAQRRAISRARQDGTDCAEATVLGMLSSAKMGQTEGVGCMAVFGGSR